MIGRRMLDIRWAWLLAVTLALPWVNGARAQAQHTRPIKVIVPFPAGDLVDIIARLLADGMAKSLGQPLVIENRPGGSGLTGLQATATAQPDGHTLTVGQLGSMVITPIMNKWQFDVRASLEPVALTYVNYIAILTTPALPVTSLRGLIDYSKANPGTVKIATVGLGSFPHLMFEMLRKQAGLDYVHVPYRGGVQIVPDLVSGRIEAGSLSFANSLSYTTDGSLRALAVSARTRNPAAPDMPTISETVPDFTMLGWFGFFAPKGTPPAMVERINAAVNRAIADPDMQKHVKSLHIDPSPGTPADLGRLWQSDYSRFTGLINELGIAAQ
jgi:tripartite-type tricarboxylate transporter receptor subunit TctC